MEDVVGPRYVHALCSVRSFVRATSAFIVFGGTDRSFRCPLDGRPTIVSAHNTHTRTRTHTRARACARARTHTHAHIKEEASPIVGLPIDSDTHSNGSWYRHGRSAADGRCDWNGPHGCLDVNPIIIPKDRRAKAVIGRRDSRLVGGRWMAWTEHCDDDDDCGGSVGGGSGGIGGSGAVQRRSQE